MTESVKVGMKGGTDPFKKRMGNKGCRNKENLAHMHTLFGPGSSPKPQIWYGASSRGTLNGICADFENFHFLARYYAIKAAQGVTYGKS